MTIRPIAGALLALLSLFVFASCSSKCPHQDGVPIVHCEPDGGSAGCHGLPGLDPGDVNKVYPRNCSVTVAVTEGECGQAGLFCQEAPSGEYRWVQPL
jgi:hypothetical protein